MFRRELILELTTRGHSVYALAPNYTAEVEASVSEIGAIPIAAGFQRCGLNIINDIYQFLRLVVLIRQVGPDLVLAYTIKPVIYGTIAAWISGVPKRFALITGLGYAFLDGGMVQSSVGFFVRKVYRYAMMISTGVIFQNPDDHKLFCSLGFVKKLPTKIINGSGVNLKNFPFQPIVLTQFVFLFSGRLYREKGIREFVSAARRIHKINPKIRFVVIGVRDENPNAIPEIEIQGWMNEGIVEFRGWVTNVQLALKECSVFVLPSYREGTPRSVLEAMATGRPIITTDAPGCRQTIVNGINGWLVKPQDEKSLADAMLDAIAKKSHLNSMGFASRNIAVARFDVTSVNREILEFMTIK